jgi:hypothetical protein
LTKAAGYFNLKEQQISELMLWTLVSPFEQGSFYKSRASLALDALMG